MFRNKNMTWDFGTILMALIGLLVISGSTAHANFTFGKPVNLRTVIAVIDPVHDCIDCCSSDGLEIYLQSDRPGGYGSGDIWVVKRDSVDAPWSPPENLGPAVNAKGNQAVSTISADGLTLYFHSNRSGGQGSFDIWMTTRATKNSPWQQAVNVGPRVNTPRSEVQPCVSPDNLELYFISERPDGYGGNDIYISRRATANDPWGDAVNLGPVVNNAYNVVSPGISPDGLILFFQDLYGAPPQPRGYGGSDLWITRRATTTSPWQTPTNLGPVLNSSGNELGPRVSPDGSTLYFFTYNGGNYENWQAPIIPIVDFNGDEIVDIQDLLRLTESWGKDDPMVDIGPMPWGDGKVDANDLEVLMSYWGQEVYDPTLLNHWKLDEVSGATAADSAGTNNGTLVGNPTWQPAGGKVGGALQFDGGPRFVTTKLVCDPAAGPFSAFAWVKGGAPGQVILSQVGGANWLKAASPDGALATELKSSGRTGVTLKSSMSITDGVWHRVGLVWDGSIRILYVDGVEVAKDTQTSLAASAGGLYIGAGSTLAGGSFWSGLIDDVRVYNRAVQP